MDRRSNIVKQVVLKIFSVAVLVCSFVVASTGADHSGTRVNLLKNPSFEETTDKHRYPAADWDATGWTGDIPTYKFKVDTTVSHTGKSSMYSECAPGTQPGAWAQDCENVTPSRTYYASVWLKGEDLANGSGLIVDDGKVNGKRPMAAVSGTFDWKKVTIKGIKPNGNRLIFTIVNRGGKLWADDTLLE